MLGAVSVSNSPELLAKRYGFSLLPSPVVRVLTLQATGPDELTTTEPKKSAGTFSAVSEVS